jgi:hypothetical protein
LAHRKQLPLGAGHGIQRGRCRIRLDDGTENFAILRRIALNPIKREKSKTSVNIKRQKAGWSTDYLQLLLCGLQPL